MSAKPTYKPASKKACLRSNGRLKRGCRYKGGKLVRILCPKRGR